MVRARVSMNRSIEGDDDNDDDGDEDDMCWTVNICVRNCFYNLM